MKRQGNTLYFRPKEREKFFRATRLYIRHKFGEEKAKIVIEHERAHLDKLIELGYEKNIIDYRITDRNGEYDISIYFTNEGMPERDFYLICLAPEVPSRADFLEVSNENLKK
jgi:hypothetical protein